MKSADHSPIHHKLGRTLLGLLPASKKHREEQQRYLENAFGLIERELMAFMEDIEAATGTVFKRYRYSEAELSQSSHLAKIESITGKVRDDLENWQSRKRLASGILEEYEARTGDLQMEIAILEERILSRRPHIWDTIRSFLRKIMDIIATIAPIAERLMITFQKPKNHY